jgi:hypothetical protein
MVVATVGTYGNLGAATTPLAMRLTYVVMVRMVVVADEQRQRREQRGNNIYCCHQKRI